MSALRVARPGQPAVLLELAPASPYGYEASGQPIIPGELPTGESDRDRALRNRREYMRRRRQAGR